MNLSMNWLSDYVTLHTTPKEFSEKMTMSGSKVEGYENPADEIENVVIGQVVSIEPHPDADKLVVCQINIGQNEPIQIVTGAKNLTPGDIIPVALDKSKLPGGKEIRKGKLRGVVSNGMLCSLSELGLTKTDFPDAIEDGIFVITDPCTIGENAATALGLDDISVEFEITSNRPDCLSVRGLALEAAATYSVPFINKEPVVRGSGGDISNEVQVTIENTDLCSRYMARMVKNVKIAPSPRWMRERLRASGLRPINNLVDITNYVMLEYGQPMHAYDARYIHGKITVRNALPNEKMTTLDGVERVLSPEMLMISDEKGAIGVAGVMGGENSDIKNDTTMVIFEAANFSGPSVRLTAKALGLRTEASGRFEKGLDPNNCAHAINRACELIELLECGEVVDGIVDIAHFNTTPVTLPLEVEWTNKFLGISLTENEMSQILEKIGFKVENHVLTVPTFRNDVRHKADVAEEIARFYGYNNIPNTFVKGEANGQVTLEQAFEQRIEDTLVGLGGYEICTYTFTSPSVLEKILLPENDFARNFVRISNPLGEERSVMRTMILPSMLDVLSRNYNNRNPEAFLFEIGSIYLPVEGADQPNEPKQLAMGLYGEKTDFFTLKGTIETLFESLRIYDYEVRPCSTLSYYHPGRCAEIFVKDKYLGVFGEIHPQVLKNYDLGNRVYTGVFELSALYEVASPDPIYTPLPKFPAMVRDLALMANQDCPAGDIEKTIRESAGAILEDLTLFDVYYGNQIAENKKSLAYHLTFRSPKATLTDEEVDGKIQKILRNLEKLDVKIRE